MLHINSFCKVYNIDYKTVYSFTRDNKHLVFKNTRNDIYINRSKLIKRIEFREKVINKAHSNYYVLIEYFSENKLSFILSKYYGTQSSWTMFLSVDLFSTSYLDKNIINYKINYRTWAFFRLTNILVKHIEIIRKVYGKRTTNTKENN